MGTFIEYIHTFIEYIYTFIENNIYNAFIYSRQGSSYDKYKKFYALTTKFVYLLTFCIKIFDPSKTDNLIKASLVYRPIDSPVTPNFCDPYFEIST